MSEIKKLQFTICGNNYTIPEFTEKQAIGKKWVNYGADNKFPEYLWSLYLKSSVQHSIIDGYANYILGDKINPIEMKLPLDSVNSQEESFQDVLKECVLDYLIYGAFAINIIYNKLGDVNEIYHVDVANLRANKGRKKFYYSSDWKKSKEVVEIDAWDLNQRQGSCIYYYAGKTRGTYGLPSYIGAINAIETQIEISNFHLNNIKNGFMPSGIVNFNNGIPSDDVKDEIENGIKEKFSGTNNAGSLIISWNDSKVNAVTFERLNDDGLDKKFSELRTDTYKEIFTAWRVPAQLFGFTTEGNLFNQQEYEDAYKLFDKTQILPIQNIIIKQFNKIFKVDNSFSILPFTVYDNKNLSQQ